jgi:uncharacterized oxidoreductase
MPERRPIVVTGASRGIGLELVRRLMEQGHPVIGIAREDPDLQDPLFRFIRCDLSDRAAVSALAQDLVQQQPGGLINNAAVQREGDPVTLSAADVAAYVGTELEVNLAAPLILGTVLMPVIAEAPEGFICNVNSCLALAPKTAAPAYCAAKAGLSNATFALRERARAWPRLLVSEVLLPLVDTDMTAGRGKGKISAAQAASGILDGVARRRAAIRIGGARMLYVIWRLSPGLARMVLRGARPGPAGRVGS